MRRRLSGLPAFCLAVAALALAPCLAQAVSVSAVKVHGARTGSSVRISPHSIGGAGPSSWVRVKLVALIDASLGELPGSAPKLQSALPGSSPAPLKLILAGAPGSGKTTIAKRLAEQYDLVPLSVGQLLRAYSKDHPEVAEVMRRGDLVDAELVMELVRDRLSDGDVKEKGFVLDGFPRRLGEAEALARLFDGDDPIDAVIHLDVPEEELKRRILARGRPDDTEETFANRLKVYRTETIPAVEAISRLAPSLSPDVARTGKAESFARVKELLERLLGSLD